jgi:diadenosine tetraphosphate (Ap4A) HIT family hydrolase
MHIHVVGRTTDDPAWPGVVWAFEGKRKYVEGEAERIVEAARDFFGAMLIHPMDCLLTRTESAPQ